MLPNIVKDINTVFSLLTHIKAKGALMLSFLGITITSEWFTNMVNTLGWPLTILLLLPITFFVAEFLFKLLVIASRWYDSLQVKNSSSQNGSSGTIPATTNNNSVVSHNQQGGITAYAVTVEDVPRKLSTTLSKDFKTQISELDKNVEITVYCQSGESESQELARELIRFLQSQGFKVNSFIACDFNGGTGEIQLETMGENIGFIVPSKMDTGREAVIMSGIFTGLNTVAKGTR